MYVAKLAFNQLINILTIARARLLHLFATYGYSSLNYEVNTRNTLMAKGTIVLFMDFTYEFRVKVAIV